MKGKQYNKIGKKRKKKKVQSHTYRTLVHGEYFLHFCPPSHDTPNPDLITKTICLIGEDGNSDIFVTYERYSPVFPL